MGEILMTGGSGGGSGSDECTATLDHVLAGETAVTSDSNDEPGTGRMTVNSIMSFSVAPYSGRRVLVKWQNPNPTPGKPFGGVIVKCMAGRYPAWNEPDANLAAGYAGVGSNTAPGGWSQVFMDMPNLNTLYYFTCFGYATTSFGDIWSPVYDPASIKQATVATGGVQNITITGTQVYTIPDGFSTIDVFCVGGGGNGSEVSRNLSWRSWRRWWVYKYCQRCTCNSWTTNSRYCRWCLRCNFIWKYLHCWWRTVWYSGWRLKSAGRKWRFRRWRRR